VVHREVADAVGQGDPFGPSTAFLNAVRGKPYTAVMAL